MEGQNPNEILFQKNADALKVIDSARSAINEMKTWQDEAEELMTIGGVGAYAKTGRVGQITKARGGLNLEYSRQQALIARREFLDTARNLTAQFLTGGSQDSLKAAHIVLEKLEHLNPNDGITKGLLETCNQALKPYRDIALPDNTLLEIVRIPAGEFVFGENTFLSKNQKTISLPEYWIGKTPVTEAQFAIFAKATGYRGNRHIDPGIAKARNHPMTAVNLSDMEAFCKWLSEISGLKFRLPTEEEWEKAARGIDGRKFPWGNENPSKDTCNISRIGPRTTTPVGQCRAGKSLYGCEDMVGNVWEMTSSIFRTGYPIIRGGAYDSGPDKAYCAFRIDDYPHTHSNNRGFRVCVSLS